MEIQCKKYVVFRAVYTAVALAVAIPCIVFACAPLTFPDKFNLGAEKIGDFYFNKAVQEVSVSSMGIVSRRFAVFKAENMQNAQDRRMCLSPGTAAEFDAQRAMDQHAIYPIKITVDDVLYQCADGKMEDLNKIKTAGVIALASVLCVLAIAVGMLWLSCQGWCRCGNPFNIKPNELSESEQLRPDGLIE